MAAKRRVVLNQNRTKNPVRMNVFNQLYHILLTTDRSRIMRIYAVAPGMRRDVTSLADQTIMNEICRRLGAGAPIPDGSAASSNLPAVIDQTPARRPLTIPEWKQSIADEIGVPPENINITIRY